MIKNPVIVIALLAALTACSTEELSSTGVTNEGLWADISVVEAGANSADVAVELNAGGNNGTNIVLADGEYVEALADSTNIKLQETDPILNVIYKGSLATTDAETTFTINLYRNDQHDALNSQVVLPEGFTISSPKSDDVLLKDQTMAIRWEPIRVNQVVELDVFLSCTKEDGKTTMSFAGFIPDDDGEFSIDLASSLVNKIKDPDTSKLCKMIIQIDREVTGDLSAEIQDGGKIRAVRSRTISNILVDISD